MRYEFDLDPNLIYLNSGTHSIAPREVLEAVTRYQREYELNPTLGLFQVWPKLWQIQKELGEFFRARPGDLFLRSSVTAVLNAFVLGIPLPSGSEILTTDLEYGAIANLCRFRCERDRLKLRALHLPLAQAEFKGLTEEALVEAVVSQLRPETKMLVLSHVVTGNGLVLPIRAIARRTRQAGVLLVVDGAHAPGMLPLSLDALGADWYVGNCHKWLCSPKGCAFLVATPEGQAGLHPPVISSYYGQGYTQEFGWTGTGDPSARLAVTAALDFIEALGFERYFAALREQAQTAARHLCAAWGVEPGAPFEMSGAMVSIPLPLPLSEAGNEETARRWHDRLREEHHIEVPVFPIEGRLWVRISAQVYNELSDYQALARAFP